MKFTTSTDEGRKINMIVSKAEETFSQLTGLGTYPN
jgi:hypothetical protein